jgi:pimeloyl-ACP methyl ester carboxylesterase
MGSKPFTIHVPDETLDDLRSRLARTRLPDPLPYTDWAAGADVGYLKELVAYWADSFDWRAAERHLNSFTQFTADIGGQQVHFVHERGRGPDPFPLVLTHGWPSCFAEMLKLAPLLTDPAAHGADELDSFDVVIPSLPGFAFSAPLPAPGATTAGTCAELWAQLMTKTLGYRRFGVQGQDLGAAVSIALAAAHPRVVAGVHLPGVLAPPPPSQPVSEMGLAFLERQRRWQDAEGAYARLQATRPQTLAAGLTDSPAGLAAWIVEKFRAWSDCDGEVERRFSKDELLTIITLYWVTGTIGTSFLFYHDRQHDPGWRPGQVEAPVGVVLFPKENPVAVPRDWAEAAYNITRWTQMPRGGHFPAAEEPELLAGELREFFRPLRQARPGGAPSGGLMVTGRESPDRG